MRGLSSVPPTTLVLDTEGVNFKTQQLGLPKHQEVFYQCAALHAKLGWSYTSKCKQRHAQSCCHGKLIFFIRCSHKLVQF